MGYLTRELIMESLHGVSEGELIMESLHGLSDQGTYNGIITWVI